ncbi:hypothetical protein [Candidatus Nitronereus thalassa]|uniref:Uncharacterized protein n=1 Tax=Candidatus Nitronereus thalassa TaxID=3020898 RepID=A0ABU3KCU9_9BACT|nr:hypothetical protein [Candidatus Nitronereus thalassa]MDT7044271.1 hypothetical protein [Candidatus Nitronereus thalassa]
MDVSAVSAASAGHEVHTKASASEKQSPPPPPPAQGDSVEISDDAKTLASKSVLDE